MALSYDPQWHERVPSPPKPGRVEHALDRAQRYLDDLKRDELSYRWAFNTAYGSSRSGEPGPIGQARIEPDGSEPGPTAAVALSPTQGVARAHLAWHAKALFEALHQLGVAVDEIAKAHGSRALPRVTDGVWAAPPLVSQAELDEARAAQQRRHARGEGYGVS